jgi:hypothetical protein
LKTSCTGNPATPNRSSEFIYARSKKAEKWAGERQRIFLLEPAPLKNVSAFLIGAGWGDFLRVLMQPGELLRKQPELDPRIESLLPRRT